MNISFIKYYQLVLLVGILVGSMLIYFNLGVKCENINILGFILILNII